jgi:hypothetical protein
LPSRRWCAPGDRRSRGRDGMSAGIWKECFKLAKGGRERGRKEGWSRRGRRATAHRGLNGRHMLTISPAGVSAHAAPSVPV